MQDLAEFLDPTLKLPIGGKTYTVEPVDAKTGLKLQRMRVLGSLVAQGIEVPEEDVKALEMVGSNEEQFLRNALGAVTYDQMVKNKVSWIHIRHAASTAFVFHTEGRDAAEKAWSAPLSRLGKEPENPSDEEPAS